ncbi:MAG: sigma-70 family RNA polymerase sigma factor [Planctomycetota bacterium]|nr:sigma-70 family RNA polymerase sigma factor [Planctomycetota bacterium]
MQPTDEGLAFAAGGGDRSAFAELVERYAGRIVAAIDRRLGDHHAALDVAQEVWIKVFRALPRFREGASFRSWLFSIALNATRDEGRRRQRRPTEGPDALVPLTTKQQPTQRLAIHDALQRVPEPFRSTLQLVDVEKFSYEEAATALGCNVGTVRSRLSRGRHAFRKQWEAEGSQTVNASSGARR